MHIGVYPRDLKQTASHNSAVHRPSGETAIVMEFEGSTVVYAQFDRFDHPQSHGWHPYARADWRFPPPVKWPEDQTNYQHRRFGSGVAQSGWMP